MKTDRVLALVGGTAGLLAFFLPWLSSGLVSISLSTLLNTPLLSQALPGYFSFLWFEPICAGGVLLFAGLAGNMGKNAYLLATLAAFLGFCSVFFFYIILLNLATQSPVSPAGTPANGPLSILSYMGLGFWMALIGFGLGLYGAVRGASDEPAYSGQRVTMIPTANQFGIPPQAPYTFQGSPFPGQPAPGSFPQTPVPHQSSGWLYPPMPGQNALPQPPAPPGPGIGSQQYDPTWQNYQPPQQ